MIEQTINLLGRKARDKVTGFRGTVTTASFDLYGCVQVILTPDVKEDSVETKHGHWFDVSRLEILETDRVMPVPSFREMVRVADDPSTYTSGAAEKPPFD